MRKEQKTNVKALSALNIQAISSNTTTVGNEIDTAGFESCTFIFHSGTITDGDYRVEITECATSGGTFTAVANADLIGLEADTSITDNTDDNQIGTIGYIGALRYVKATVVSTNVTTGGTVGMQCILGDPLIKPYSQTALT